VTTYSAATVWILIGVIGAGTFALRISMIALLGKASATPPVVDRILRFVRPAVLAALIAPAVMYMDGEVAFVAPLNSRLIAAVVATFIAWKTRNVLLTIAGGMSVLWIVQWIL
jgi:branched-subunit amino acid transport protein